MAPPKDLTEAVAGFLTKLGIGTVERIDGMLEAAEAVFYEHGFEVTVVAHRWDEITVETDPRTKHLLSWEMDDIRTQISQRADRPLSRVTVRCPSR